MLAPAQTGIHPATRGKARKTHGHSMIISPWGEVLLDAGTDAGVYMADLDMGAVQAARNKIPSLSNARLFAGPE